ncbi:hypothetical protein HMPREF0322_00395 [Desulfitobacterium hafniense DP7]|uniref:Zinc-ribbon domain-containing protein n=1 Tax=Desulfitobacterium hafniense DP7 TaxID=537010 RepID=G9XHH0_DESHA|nr:zinc ribbon domain-containing protein [Desulfitobacterium hafniense]EHL08972.1 hypothetical protein HMPREF0322_00395 [Desulfitobacterium hafniense DP7]
MNNGLTACKVCGEEVAKGAKACPKCGADNRSFFARHKVLTVILAFILLGSAGSVLGEDGNKSELTSEPVTLTPQVEVSDIESPTTPTPPVVQQEGLNVGQDTDTPLEKPIELDSETKERIKAKLDKLEALEKLEEQKNFMMCIAQDDLEGYTWGEECLYPDTWKQAYMKANYNGNLVLSILGSDLDIYLAFGNSEYSLVWASADLTYEAFKSGKMEEVMPREQYDKIVNRLNAVKKRLGFLYAKREYIIED